MPEGCCSKLASTGGLFMVPGIILLVLATAITSRPNCIYDPMLI